MKFELVTKLMNLIMDSEEGKYIQKHPLSLGQGRVYELHFDNYLIGLYSSQGIYVRAYANTYSRSTFYICSMKDKNDLNVVFEDAVEELETYLRENGFPELNFKQLD